MARTTSPSASRTSRAVTRFVTDSSRVACPPRTSHISDSKASQDTLAMFSRAWWTIFPFSRYAWRSFRLVRHWKRRTTWYSTHKQCGQGCWRTPRLRAHQLSARQRRGRAEGNACHRERPQLPCEGCIPLVQRVQRLERLSVRSEIQTVGTPSTAC